MKGRLLRQGFGAMIAAVALAGCAGFATAAPDQKTPSEGLLTFAPADIDWAAVPPSPDGRQRVVLWGDTDRGGPWVYRVRVSGRLDVAPHIHPVDEYITVIEGDWSIGFGERFDASALRRFPAGSFVRIPAGTPHFIAVGEAGAIIQGAGDGRFTTAPVGLHPP